MSWVFSVSNVPKKVTSSALPDPTETMFFAVDGGWICTGWGRFGSSSAAVPSNRSGRVGVASCTRLPPRIPPLLPTGLTIMKSRLL